jgi:hypothetical protein
MTTNADDQIFDEEAASSDPVVEYSLLGDDVSAGIFGWVAFGIDLTNEGTITAAASLYSEGGVADSSSLGGGSSGNGTNGTSGPPPS